MRLPRIVLAVAVLSLAATSTAGAAPRPKPKPKPICLIVKDDVGDSRSLLPTVSSPLVDIISADIATSKNELVAVVRLAATSDTGDTWTRLRYDWAMGTTANGQRYEFRASLNGSGVWTNSVQVADRDIPHTFTKDHKTKSFIWKVKRKDVKEMARPKLFWSKFTVNTQIFSSTSDSADNNDFKYPDLHPSCVRAA